MEQITCLLFIKHLDDLQTPQENKAVRTGKPVERVIFPKGKDSKGRKYADLRWHRRVSRNNGVPHPQSTGW